MHSIFYICFITEGQANIRAIFEPKELNERAKDAARVLFQTY